MDTTATPLPEEFSAKGLKSVGWWHQQDERIVCDLCPRCCALKEGDYGFCFVRQNMGGQMVLNTYGRSTGFCIDPVEKKPLNHFFPGSSVLSFGGKHQHARSMHAEIRHQHLHMMAVLKQLIEELDKGNAGEPKIENRS